MFLVPESLLVIRILHQLHPTGIVGVTELLEFLLLVTLLLVVLSHEIELTVGLLLPLDVSVDLDLNPKPQTENQLMLLKMYFML